MEPHTPTTDLSRARRHRRGFTLAEGLIAATLLAVAVCGVVAPINASWMQFQAAEQSTVAASLARQLLDEIASKAFYDPSDGSQALGPEAGETGRAGFDNIDDYHLYTDTTSGITMLDGSTRVVSGEGAYTRLVKVEIRAAPSGAAAATGDFLLVTVSVTAPNGAVATLNRLFCRYRQG